MKLALLGSGKTGSKVAEIFKGELTVFDTANKASVEKLKGHDVLISFLPGNVFLEHIPMLIEAKLSVVTGSTGFAWPDDINENLATNHLTWIRSHNFSLGMNIVREMIYTLRKATELFETYSVNIHEVHHTKKVDAPSGTALSWKDWIGEDANMTYERTGDVVGHHSLVFDTPTEKITLVHDAKDRAIFAQGAIWAANLLTKKKLTPGLLHFNDVVKEELNLKY